jgi:hypothetical protein
VEAQSNIVFCSCLQRFRPAPAAGPSTGETASQYGIDFVAAADWEIIPDRIVAAFNLLYQPETMRSKLTGTWSQESTAGVAMAVMAQVGSGIFAGGEARYLRKYQV